MKNKHFGILWICLWILLFSLSIEARQLSEPEYQKAVVKVKELIRRNTVLVKKERELEQLITQAKNHLSPKRQISFSKGQQKWLKQRVEACVVDLGQVSPKEQISCLESVDDNRIREIHLQMQSPFFNRVDFDRILDQPVNLSSSYYGQTTAMVYPDQDSDSKTTHLPPHTCRELHTFSAGGWGYGSDNGGMTSSGVAHKTCDFKIRSAQNWRPISETRQPVNFRDFTQYSKEFACFCWMPGCEDVLKNIPIMSFAAASKKGGLKIVRGQFPGLYDQLYDSYGKEELTLTTNQDGFAIAGMNYRVENIVVGDFTHQGRREALLTIMYYPGMTAFRINTVALVYFDKAKGAIRPELINEDDGNLYHLKTKVP